MMARGAMTLSQAPGLPEPMALAPNVSVPGSAYWWQRGGQMVAPIVVNVAVPAAAPAPAPAVTPSGDLLPPAVMQFVPPALGGAITDTIKAHPYMVLGGLAVAIVLVRMLRRRPTPSMPAGRMR